MGELGELLELLYRAGDSWRTARVTMRRWHHLPRGEQAMRRVHEGAGTAQMVMVGGRHVPEPPETHESTIRVWIDGPDRAREEQEDGDTTTISVRDGDTWWTYHPGWGAQTNDGDPSHQAGVGDSAGPLLDPARLIGSLAFERVEPGLVKARPRGRPEQGFALHEIGFGADEYELVVDPERGILRRVTAFVDGEPFHELELLDAAFDEELPPDTFRFEPPQGVTVRRAGTEVEPLTLAEAAERAPFTVLAPSEVPPEWRLHVVFFGDGPFAPTVFLGYTSRQAGESVSIQETSAQADDPMAGVPWAERDGVLVWEPERQFEPRHVRVEREGTRATLSSPELPLEQLVELARSLEPA